MERYEGERPSEEAMRLAQEEREREHREWRDKMQAVSEAKSALDTLYRIMRWKTETYARPHDYSDARFAEEMEIKAWAVQGASETLRERMPELFWPRGTPVSIAGAVFYRTERLEAFKLDLQAMLESVQDVLLDTVDPSDEEEDGEEA